jgi:hypothetical protein
MNSRTGAASGHQVSAKNDMAAAGLGLPMCTPWPRCAVPGPWPRSATLGPFTALPAASRLARMFTLVVLDGWDLGPLSDDAQLIVGDSLNFGELFL